MVKIGPVAIDTPVMNAACSVAKSLQDVEALARTTIGVILVGSITVEPRDGNPEPRWFVSDNFALNSFGMPNQGLAFYGANVPKMIDVAHNTGKKFALSVAGFSTAEYVTLAKLAEETKVDLLELNFGCPNVSIDGKQKPIVSFDPVSLDEIVLAVSKVTKIPLMIKLSPYSNPAELAHIAEVINASGKVSAVVTSNTFPNGYQTNAGEPVIASEFGGVSGSVMLPISLGQVRQFRNALNEEIAVIGVGGIETAEDAKQYFDAGAELVQCATLIVRDGHQAINQVAV
jgi:dihydroorotate dehydrogenase (fumarate)